ncbi:hypothetical protein WJX84_000787 [Apatococcus fuscideae]|uniref:Uncharacterized protein n=1 Tax=Apatococcus fuscideae TaxID=2026836 RepID=A0AAW1SNG5_9CHLO
MVSHRDMRLTSLLHGLACPAAADPSCLPADRFAALKEINNLLGRPDRTARFNAMTRSLQALHPQSCWMDFCPELGRKFLDLLGALYQGGSDAALEMPLTNWDP